MKKTKNKKYKIRTDADVTVYNNIKASKRFFYTYNKYKDVKIMINLSYAMQIQINHTFLSHE
jgi:hypothetical protein